LIGIVKKNAIMMIDFALQAERSDAATEGSDPQGLLAPLPADHDDDVGWGPLIGMLERPEGASVAELGAARLAATPYARHDRPASR